MLESRKLFYRLGAWVLGQLSFSFIAAQALLGEWWSLVNEVRTAAVVTDLGRTGLPTPESHTGRVGHDVTQQSAPTSLLDDVEQDTFRPG